MGLTLDLAAFLAGLPSKGQEIDDKLQSNFSLDAMPTLMKAFRRRVIAEN
jgi:hypothetical protein